MKNIIIFDDPAMHMNLLPITYTRFALGGQRDFPWFEWEEDEKLEKDNEEARKSRS